jgi:hypothetical protein
LASWDTLGFFVKFFKFKISLLTTDGESKWRKNKKRKKLFQQQEKKIRWIQLNGENI